MGDKHGIENRMRVDAREDPIREQRSGEIGRQEMEQERKSR